MLCSEPTKYLTLFILKCEKMMSYDTNVTNHKISSSSFRLLFSSCIVSRTMNDNFDQAADINNKSFSDDDDLRLFESRYEPS